MKIKGITVEELDAQKGDIWDSFVNNTSQYSIFSSSSWLKTISESMGAEIKFLICYKGNEPVAGLPLCISNTLEGRIVKHPVLTQFSGVHLRSFSNKYPYKKEIEERNILFSVIDYLESEYDYVNLISHPTFIDVRPFQWRGWSSKVRYTYQIKFRNEDFITMLSTDIKRRAEISRKRNIRVELSNDYLGFFDLWKKTHKRQGIKTPLKKDRFLQMVLSLHNKKLLLMYAALNKENELLSANIEVIDGENVFYWAAAHDPNFVDSGANQLLISETLKKLNGSFLTFDLAGGDIPNIAYYKSTFGGTLIPHYQVSKAISLRAKSIRFLKEIYHYLKSSPQN